MGHIYDSINERDVVTLLYLCKMLIFFSFVLSTETGIKMESISVSTHGLIRFSIFSSALLRTLSHEETTKVITIVPQMHSDIPLLCPSVYCFAPLRDRLNLMFFDKMLAYCMLSLKV